MALWVHREMDLRVDAVSTKDGEIITREMFMHDLSVIDGMSERDELMITSTSEEEFEFRNSAKRLARFLRAR